MNLSLYSLSALVSAVLAGTAFTVDAYLDARSSPVCSPHPRVCLPIQAEAPEASTGQGCSCPHAEAPRVRSGAPRLHG